MRMNCASTTNVSPSNKSAFSSANGMLMGRLSCSVNENEMLSLSQTTAKNQDSDKKAQNMEQGLSNSVISVNSVFQQSMTPLVNAPVPLIKPTLPNMSLDQVGIIPGLHTATSSNSQSLNTTDQVQEEFEELISPTNVNKNDFFCMYKDSFKVSSDTRDKFLSELNKSGKLSSSIKDNLDLVNSGSSSSNLFPLKGNGKDNKGKIPKLNLGAIKEVNTTQEFSNRHTYSESESKMKDTLEAQAAMIHKLNQQVSMLLLERETDVNAG